MFSLMSISLLAVFVFASSIPVVALIVAHHYIAKDSPADENH